MRVNHKQGIGVLVQMKGEQPHKGRVTGANLAEEEKKLNSIISMDAALDVTRLLLHDAALSNAELLRVTGGYKEPENMKKIDPILFLSSC